MLLYLGSARNMISELMEISCKLELVKYYDSYNKMPIVSILRVYIRDCICVLCGMYAECIGYFCNEV